MSKLPSPCLGVCKFRIQGSYCTACSMTKVQKSLFKSIKKEKAREAFITMLSAQHDVVGGAKGWVEAYRRKCDKKGSKAPPMLHRH